MTIKNILNFVCLNILTSMIPVCLFHNMYMTWKRKIKGQASKCHQGPWMSIGIVGNVVYFLYLYIAYKLARI